MPSLKDARDVSAIPRAQAGSEQRYLIGLAQLDGDAVGGAIGTMDEGRAQGMEQLAHRLAGQQLLRPGTTEGQAADLLWVLTSFDSFDLLYSGRHRTSTQTVDLLTAAAERSVLRPE